MMFSRILVPLDGSSLELAALEAAREIALRTRGLVTLVRWAGANTRPTDSSQEDELVACGSYLRQCAEWFSSEVRVQTSVLDGDTAPECLVQAAYDFHSDLIVMLSHRRQGLGRLLFGSVAEEVARRAPCPTLIVAHHASA